jgi:hypothetical protein
VSFNIEGIKNNQPYLDEIKPMTDIICIQEHWLFSCEKVEAQKYTGNPDNDFKSVDDNNQFSPWRLPRGYGGVATTWAGDIKNFIKRCPELGNNRIQVIKCSLPSELILLVNCYMPSGNSVKIKEEYIDNLQLIDSILALHLENHTILLVGDFNIDLYNRRKTYDGRRRALTDLLRKYGLVVLSDGTMPTMLSHDGRSSSHIDIMATNRPGAEQLTVEVLDKVPWNTSCHTPVLLRLPMAHGKEMASVATPVKPTIYSRAPRILWDTLDKGKFQHTLVKAFEDRQSNLLLPSDQIKLIQETVSSAAENCAEVIKPKTGKARKTTYPKPVIDAIKKSRLTHYLWKNAGRPRMPHPLAKNRRKSSRAVRAAQRRHTATQRQKKIRSIMGATLTDQRTFHMLLRSHTVQSTQINPVHIGDQLVKDPGKIMQAWARYFEDLATPSHNPAWTDHIKQNAIFNLELVKQLWQVLRSKQQVQMEVTAKEVSLAIKALNVGKAPDEVGLVAEHLKKAGQAVIGPLQSLLTTLLQEGRIPEELKEGRKIPFPKKEKDPFQMSNHRGITITSLIGKLLEHVILLKIKNVLPQNDLQYGFTEDRSPTMAALCVTEAVGQASVKTPLIVVTLDVEKAFDRVDHCILLQKIFSAKIPLNIWATVASIYDGPQERVVINGLRSREYEVHQGVRQGGVLSTHLYKLYIHDLLETLQTQAEGLHIGPYFLASPTCADDLLLMAGSELEMQEMLDIVHSYAKDHRYNINPTKTTLTFFGKDPESELFLGEESIKPTNDFVHLGITRTSRGRTSGHPTLVEDRVKLGRRTVYALVPAGLHGQDGLSPSTSAAVIKAYVLPRIIYGMEAIILSKSDLCILDRGYKRILRDLQSLSKQVASEAIFLLIGLLPIQAEIHIRTLILFGAVARLPESSMLKALAERQIALQKGPKDSWFCYALGIAKIYSLDTMALSLLYYPPGKEDWKNLVTSTIREYWSYQLKRTAMEKSSLKYMDIAHLDAKKPNPIWPDNAPSASILAASYRAKMLTGTYILQATRAKYNQHTVDPKCQLCGLADEDMVHFIVTCPALEQTRQKKMVEEICPLVQKLGAKVPTDAQLKCRFILNGALAHTPVVQTRSLVVDSKPANRSRLQKACSTLCYRLHLKRFELLSEKMKI